MTSPNPARTGPATTLAIIGIVGTIVAGLGSSFITGRTANDGIARQFEQQRSAELDGLRREAYAKFLESAEVVFRSNEPSDEEVQAYEQALAAAESAVLLLATARVQDAARAISHTLLESDYTADEYSRVRRGFIEAAQVELNIPS